MKLPDITVKIWVQPHRAYGYVKSIDTCWRDDVPAQGLYQSFKDNDFNSDKTEIDYQYPLKEIEISERQIRELLALVDSASYSFIEHPSSNALGRSNYGLQIERGSHLVTLGWNGFEFQDEIFQKIWSFVDSAINV